MRRPEHNGLLVPLMQIQEVVMANFGTGGRLYGCQSRFYIGAGLAEQFITNEHGRPCRTKYMLSTVNKDGKVQLYLAAWAWVVTVSEHPGRLLLVMNVGASSDHCRLITHGRLRL